MHLPRFRHFQMLMLPSFQLVEFVPSLWFRMCNALPFFSSLVSFLGSTHRIHSSLPVKLHAALQGARPGSSLNMQALKALSSPCARYRQRQIGQRNARILTIIMKPRYRSKIHESRVSLTTSKLLLLDSLILGILSRRFPDFGEIIHAFHISFWNFELHFGTIAALFLQKVPSTLHAHNHGRRRRPERWVKV